MATLVVVEGQEYKKRSPLAVWGLLFVTFGIYGLVWYYKINKETKRYLADPSISPGVSLLAITLGAILVVPPLISYYRTGERILRTQQRAGVTSQISPALGLLASFFMALNVPYMQEHLNRTWDQAVARGTVLPAPAPAPAQLQAPPPPVASVPPQLGQGRDLPPPMPPAPGSS